jgi:hypothetical protein
VGGESCLEGVDGGGDRVVGFVGEELSAFGERGDEGGDVVDVVADADRPDIEIGPPVDTFGGARGEANARTFEVYGYAFLARKPDLGSPKPAQPM